MFFKKLLALSPAQGRPLDISGTVILKFFIISFFLVAISSVPSTSGIMYYGALGLMGLLLLGTLFLPFFPSVVLLLLLLVAGNDNVSTLDSLEGYSTVSVWQIQFGVIRGSWIVFACIFVKLLQAIKFLRSDTLTKRAVLWFATVPIATGILYAGSFADYVITETIVDIKFPLMLLSSVVLFQTVFKNNPRRLVIILSALIGGLFARHLMDLVLFTANFGPAISEGVSRGSVDSAKGGVVFLIYLGFFLILVRKRLLLGSVVSILSVLLLAAYASRMLWVSFLFGSIVLFACLESRRRVLFIAVMIAMIVGGGGMLFMVHQNSAKIVFARLKMITHGRNVEKFSVDVDYNYISRIDPVRYAEFLNILHSTHKRFSYLWGTGYGGYYEDDAVGFTGKMESAFPEYSVDAGMFFRAHFYPLHIFLKHGLLGLICISSLWLVPGYSLYKRYRRENLFSVGRPIMFHGSMLCLLAFLPTAMLQLYWSGKGLFINGVIIASYMEFAKNNSSNAVGAVRTCNKVRRRRMYDK